MVLEWLSASGLIIIMVLARVLWPFAPAIKPTSAVSTPFTQPTATAAEFSANVGEWDIEGVVMGAGNTIVCKMQKTTQDGIKFAYIFMLSAGSDGSNLMDAYVTPSSLPEGSIPKVTIYFDGKKTIDLNGGVEKGYLHVDLAKLNPTDMLRLINLFSASKLLVEVIAISGHPSERVTVDLSNSHAAFAERGICAKVVTEIGMARVRHAD